MHIGADAFNEVSSSAGVLAALHSPPGRNLDVVPQLVPRDISQCLFTEEARAEYPELSFVHSKQFWLLADFLQGSLGFLQGSLVVCVYQLFLPGGV